MVVINGLGVDNPGVGSGGPRVVEGPRSYRGSTETGQMAQDPALLPNV